MKTLSTILALAAVLSLTTTPALAISDPEDCPSPYAALAIGDPDIWPEPLRRVDLRAYDRNRDTRVCFLSARDAGQDNTGVGFNVVDNTIGDPNT